MSQFIITFEPKHGFVAQTNGSYEPQTFTVLIDELPDDLNYFPWLTTVKYDTSVDVYSPYNKCVVATPETEAFIGLVLGNQLIVNPDGTPYNSLQIAVYQRCEYYAKFAANLAVGTLVTAGTITDGVIVSVKEAEEEDAIYGIVRGSADTNGIGRVFFDVALGHGQVIPAEL